MPKLSRQQSLDLALDYITMNPTRRIFPIKAGAKFPPCIKDNLRLASSDPQQIREWAVQFPGCNWGLSLYGGETLIVVDVDTKEGKNGQATYDDHALMYGWPPTETVRTPSGGFHEYYEGKHIFALGIRGFGDGIDSPNYVIIAGCQFSDDTAYVLEKDLPVAKAPAWFYDVIGRAKQKNESASETLIDWDKDENVSWAESYFDDPEQTPPAIEGKNGNAQTFRVAVGARDRAISEEKCFELMLARYNERCIPPWEPEELRRVVANAYKYASQSAAGERTAEVDFQEDSDFDPASIKTEWTDEQIAVARRKRKADRKRENAKPAQLQIDARITKKTLLTDWIYIGGVFDKFIEKDDPERQFWPRETMNNYFKHLQDKGKLTDALLGLKVGGISKFKGLGYKPGEGEVLGSLYNMYRPSGIVPAKGDLKWWDDHLAYLFPDELDRRIVTNWLAWFLQNISEKPKHALLIQGKMNGTGKSFISNMLAAIIGKSNLSVVDQGALSGDFNGYAWNKKLLVVEELRAVDRNEVKNALHPLISEERITINEKNLKRFDTDNCFGVICMTNEDAAISLDLSDRRYLVVRTDAKPKDTAYYDKLYGLLKDTDAIAALAYHLLNWDYGNYTGAGRAPETTAKSDMISSGLTELETFMLDNRDTWPLCARLTTVQDVVDMLPGRIQTKTGRLMPAITSALKNHFDWRGEQQVTLSGNSRRRLHAINGCPIFQTNMKEQAGSIYELDKKNKQAGPESDFDASELDTEEDG